MQNRIIVFQGAGDEKKARIVVYVRNNVAESGNPASSTAEWAPNCASFRAVESVLTANAVSHGQTGFGRCIEDEFRLPVGEAE